MRYYIGVDWADAEHAIWVADEEGTRGRSRTPRRAWLSGGAGWTNSGPRES